MTPGAVGRTRSGDAGDYELIEPIGLGGMGEVWRARDRRLGRAAAVKLIRGEFLAASGAQAARTRFDAEARLTAALASAHTVRVFDVGTTSGGDPFYAMELLRGSDLQRLVCRFGPMPCDRVACLLAQVCEAIGEAHARGLVHGDIKPANLYACHMGLRCDFAKVLDFGLARPERQAVSVCVSTEQSVTLGTPAYMAPETILGAGAVDRKTDVYALGCVAYFLLTGRLVFEAGTPLEIFQRHLRAEPVKPSRTAECFIPPGVDDLVLACLQKDPALRPRDAAELQDRWASAASAWTQAAAKAWWERHLPEVLQRN